MPIEKQSEREDGPSLVDARNAVGEWLSLVEHLVRDQGVGGSNPLSPTILFKHLNWTSGFPSTSMVSIL
jgi:hypothetical protein